MWRGAFPLPGFGADGADGAIESVSLLSASIRDRGGHEDDRYILCIFEFFGLQQPFGIDADLASQELHVPRQGAQSWPRFAIAGSLETDDDPEPHEGVLLLTLKSTYIADQELRLVGGNGLV